MGALPCERPHGQQLHPRRGAGQGRGTRRCAAAASFAAVLDAYRVAGTSVLSDGCATIGGVFALIQGSRQPWRVSRGRVSIDMLLRSFSVKNYKSFAQSPVLKFGPGLNAIVGTNNAGKTALLEAMTLGFAAHPHRSEKSLPDAESRPEPASEVRFEFEFARDEIERFFQHRFDEVWFWTRPSFRGDTNKALQEILSMDRFCFSGTCRRHPDDNWLVLAGVPYGDAPASPDEAGTYIRCKTRPVVSSPGNKSAQFPHEKELGSQLLPIFRGRIFRFKAERLNLGSGGIGVSSALNSDARNLVEVLSTLQANPVAFEQYNEAVRRVFPGITRVTLVPVSNVNKEIRIWTGSPSSRRQDLAIPLSEAGTGVGQVLAMLYVVLSAEQPHVLLIDEPNSFLHPGAVKELMAIFRENDRHQYIVSTHSPGLLDAARPSYVHLLKWQDGETKVRTVDPRDLDDQRLLLSEVGASLSEVFAADAILWVEGPTEAQAFPLILERLGGGKARTAILPVLHTGDFAAGQRTRSLQIYKRLSKGVGLVPPAVGFLFDRESRQPKELEALRRDGKVHLTERKMFENYLLWPEAIAEVLGRALVRAEIEDKKVSVEDVVECLETFPGQPCQRSRDLVAWERDVDGGRALQHVFSSISEEGLPYDKIRHGYELTKEILATQPERLAPLADEIRGAWGGASAPTAVVAANRV